MWYFLFNVIVVGLYILNPNTPGLIGTLHFFSKIPLISNLLLSFPISIHRIGDDLNNGVHPGYSKLLDLEVTRWIIVIVMNFLELYPDLLQTTLLNHCSTLLLGEVLQHFKVKRKNLFIGSMNFAWILFFFFESKGRNFPKLLIFLFLSWFNHEIHKELLSSSQSFPSKCVELTMPKSSSTNAINIH
jgi:hypothetical protein